MVRRDWSPLSKDCGNFALDAILSGRPREDVVHAIHAKLHEVIAGSCHVSTDWHQLLQLHDEQLTIKVCLEAKRVSLHHPQPLRKHDQHWRLAEHGGSLLYNLILDLIAVDLADQLLSMCATQEPGLARQVREKLAAGAVPLGKFVITKQLTRRPEEYPDAKSQPHVQVALRRKAQNRRDGTLPVRALHACAGSAVPHRMQNSAQ